MASKPFLRTAYNYDTMEASNESAIKCEDPSLAQQSARDESDINFIVDRFTRTGELPQPSRLPVYADFQGIFDFQTAQNAIRAAQESFNALPARVRERFSNDPQQLMAFIEDPKNLSQAVELGLANPPPPEPVKTAPETVKPSAPAA